MQVTDVRIRKISDDDKMKAIVSIMLDALRDEPHGFQYAVGALVGCEQIEAALAG